MTATNPDPIVTAATGFMAAKQLFAASRIGLFGALADGPLTAEALAERLGTPVRTTRIVADAMVGLELLSLADGRYVPSEAADAYLSGRAGSLDLRPYLAFWEEISYPHWLAFDETVRSGEPAPLSRAGDRQSTILAGVDAFNALHAAMLVERYDFSRHARVLDLGGLSGSFLALAARRHPHLSATFFADLRLVERARGAVPPELLDKISFVVGDILTDPVPAGHDLVLLEHVAHRYEPAQNREIMTRARGAVEPGTTMLVLDFFLREAVDRSLDALIAGEYMVVDGTVVYPEPEVRGWIEATGWRAGETLTLPGSPHVIVAEAV